MLSSRTCIGASKCRGYSRVAGMLLPSRKLSQQNSITPKRMTPTVLELIQQFPIGLKALYKDVQQYYNITSASSTVNNAWAKRGGMHHIPRRQAEQQRKLVRDLAKVAIPVSFATLPVIGNSIFIFCAWKPSFFLSNHFYKKEYHRKFMHDEYRNRVGAYVNCAEDFWNTIMMQASDIHLQIEGNDEAGPIFDAIPLYRVFYKFKSAYTPHQQMVNIAKASGMASPLLSIVPKSLIQSRLKSMAKDIILDDANLIEENHKDVFCESLTDDEVLEACSLRGLPCRLNHSFGDMRKSLTNYLTMMESTYKIVGKDVLLGDTDGGVMFVLLLQAIRLKMKVHK